MSAITTRGRAMDEPTLKGLPLSWWEARYSYNPETGEVTGQRGVCKARDPSGRIYVGARHNGRTVMAIAYRLAWLLAYRQAPPSVIDHINGDPSDNRLTNLRRATQSQNLANAKIPVNNTSGLKGVCWDRNRRKWAAKIGKDRKSYHLGLFDCPKEAHEAYMKAANEMFGEFSRSA